MMGKLEEDIELQVEVLAQTERAVLVFFDEDRNPIWLPLSQVDLEPRGKGLHLLRVPGWLAVEKDMV